MFRKCKKCGKKEGRGFAECGGNCGREGPKPFGPAVALPRENPHWSPEFQVPAVTPQPRNLQRPVGPNQQPWQPQQPQQPWQPQPHMDPWAVPRRDRPPRHNDNTDLFTNLVMQREQKHETEKADLHKKIKELEDALAETEKKSKATIRALDTEVATLKAKDPRQPKLPKKGFKHNAWCNQCSFMGNGSSNIIGTRYKCIMCPNYDLCEACMNLHDACIPKDGKVADAEYFHNIYHGFVRMPISHANDPRPLYADRSYAAPGSLTCDVCASNINRFRFHCIQCDINFCETCELMGQHPVTHTRIKRIQLDQPAGHLQGGKPPAAFN